MENRENESQLNLFKKWVVSLDKYIDVKYHRKAKFHGFITGVFIFVLFLWMSDKLGMSSKYVTIILLGMFPFGFVFVQANQLGWRIRRQLNQIGAYDCGCDQRELTLFGNHNWLKTRVISHYTCTIYMFICFFILGWYLASFLGVLIYFIR